MKPLALFLFLASLATPVLAQNPPTCVKDAGAGQSTNWGPNYDLYVQEIFQKALKVAELPPNVKLYGVKVRSIDGSPISALPKGTPVRGGTLDTDAVVYGFGLFEIVCDQAQLATFMLHEMRHIKVVADKEHPNGVTHFEKASECRKRMVKEWLNDPSTSLPADVNLQAAMAQFNKEKGADYQKTCVAPIEKEADEYAFSHLSMMGVQASSASSPSQDARAQSFMNADLWAKALGENGCDDGHGCLADRAKAGEAAAAEERMKAAAELSKKRLQSFDPNALPGGD